ncbi:MAG: GEVED domain-containing protein, partial [Candidatus Tenebribacter burtonii]|nr:GEVED domain-containing protein [Candidatus Tenebribacter burtonii]
MKKILILLFVTVFAVSAFADITLSSTPIRETEKTNHSFYTRDILYEQLANISTEGGVTSQNFEAGMDTYDAEGADEFVVPVGETWTIDEVAVLGVYAATATGPCDLGNVRFYEDAAGMPGTLLYEYLDVPASPNATGDLDCLIPDTVLPEGTYWLGFQGSMDYTPYGQWFWTKQAAPTIGSEFHWRNPGDGFAMGFTTWTTGSLPWPAPDYVDYNLSFGIYGTNGAPSTYPVSYGSDNDYEWITNVTFANINNTTAADPGGYGDYTAMVADVVIGETHDLSTTIEFDSNDYVTAWIDWNHDYDFIDAGEEYIIASGVSAIGPFTVPVTVPAGAFVGETRMRVSVKWAAAPLPDEIFSYGEVEDYTLSITEASGSVAEYILNTVIDGGNPGGLNTDTDSYTTDWIEVAPPSQNANIWTAGALPADFDFLFFNEPVTDYKVSQNGLLTFDLTAADPPPDVNVNLPDATCPDMTIAAFWDEFTANPPTGSNDRVYTKTFGTAPNRQVWFKYHSFEYSTYSFAYFGFCLEETTNRVYIVDYNYFSGTSDGATVGLQYDATTAIEQADSPNYVFLAGGSGNGDNDYYEFIPLIPGAPGYPENPVPASGSIDLAAAGDLMWDFGVDTDTYDLWFGPAGAMTEVVTGASAGATGSYAYSGLAYSNNYEWQVICHNAAVDLTSNGSVWNFTVMNDPIFAQIGDCVTTGMSLPIEPYYGYSWSNCIYLASEVMTSGDITGVQYQYQSTAGFGPDDIVIYMGHTTQTEFVDGDNWIDVTTMTEVYNGPFSVTPGAGNWVGITFPVPFAYNGTDNLVIGFDENTQGYHSGTDEFWCTDTTPIRGICYYNDSTNPDPLAPPTANAVRNAFPNVRLNGLIQPNGTLSGYVYEFGTTNPIENAKVECTCEMDYTDATGYYEIPGILIGTYDATASHDSYFDDTASVTILDATVTTQDFYLGWAEIMVDPMAVNEYVDPGVSMDVVFTVTNNGPFDLAYNPGLNFISDEIRKTQFHGYTGPVSSSIYAESTISTNDVPRKTINNSDAMWDLQFAYDVDTPSGLVGLAGAETDGTYLYATKWSGTVGEIAKFNLDGTFVETITIPGVTGLRDLAYDGTYFYGSNASSYIWEMDFDTQTLISTITTPTSVRSIAYDSDLDGFWYNNFSSDLIFVDRTGTQLNTIVAPPSMYGCAYDNLTAGGPYLWIFTGTTTGLGCQAEQYDLNTLTLTAVTHSIDGDLGAGAYIAGGMFLQPDLISGTYTLGGLAQGTPDLLYGYELGVTETWLSITDSGPGVVIPGGTAQFTATLDATDQINGDVRTGEVIVSNNAITIDPVVVPVTMSVGGAPVAPDVFFSEYIEGSSYNKALEIYNGTGATINLDDFQLWQISNGGDWFEYAIDFPVGSTLDAEDVWVVCHTDADPAMLAVADQILTLYHNGNDAQGLAWNNGTELVLIDVIGQDGADPGAGWDVAGETEATKDHTLIRKDAIMTGNTDWALSAGTNTTDSEWIVYPQNTFDYLGSHGAPTPELDPPSNLFVTDLGYATWNAPPAIIAEDNFDSYTVGDYLAVVNPALWTTWSNLPGSSEDVLVSDAQANSPSNSILVELNNDCVMIMDDYTSGVYSMDIDMFVPTGFCGYYNMQKTSVIGTEWAWQIYFQTDGTALADAGAAGALTFAFNHDEWMDLKLVIDLDTDWCDFYFNGEHKIGYQWSL